MMPSILARSRTMRSGLRGARTPAGPERRSRPAGLRACAGHSLHTLRMGHDTYGDDGDQGQPEDYYGQPEDYHRQTEDYHRGQPEAYWRRRVIALCAGLALMAMLAWAFSGSGKAPSSVRKGSQESSATALPAAAYSSSPASPSPGAGGPAG